MTLPAALFCDTDVTHLAEPIVAERPRVVAAARDVLLGGEPEREPGEHCDDPFACSFKSYCSRHLPPRPPWPVTILPDGARA